MREKRAGMAKWDKFVRGLLAKGSHAHTGYFDNHTATNERVAEPEGGTGLSG
jgi:hypothetical protein